MKVLPTVSGTLARIADPTWQITKARSAIWDLTYVRLARPLKKILRGMLSNNGLKTRRLSTLLPGHYEPGFQVEGTCKVLKARWRLTTTVRLFL
jgi:hypothetical protein